MIKLNIKRFGTTITSSGAWETGADAANNLSYVYATFTQKAASNTYNQSGSAYYNISCDGQSTGNVSFKFAKGSTLTFSATLGPFYHAADGSLGNKTVTIYVNGDVNNSTHTMNHTVSFTKFARGFSSIPTLTLTSKNSSMFSFDWRTSEAASDVYYDLYNAGGTLLRTERIGGNGASVGSFQLSGLSSNTTYKVRVRAVRQDSGLSDNGTSATGSYTTYIQPTLTVSLVSRTETSLKIKATPNTAVASKSWSLNLNNVAVKTSTSTAETVEFTGLSANTTYQLVVSYVSTSANGSLPSDSVVKNYATYAYPYLKSISVNPLTIGNQQTVTLYNPLGRTMTVYMNKTNTGGALLYNGTTSVAGENATFSFTPNATTLYNNFPSGSDVTCVYYSKYNNTQYGTAQTGKYKLIGTEKPTFPATSWSYSADLTSLTNNNQVVIDNYSTVTATLNTAATSNYGTGVTMSKYEFTWNTTQQLSGTTTGSTASIAQGTGSTISMSVTDSRGLSQIAQKNLVSGTTYIPYVAPTISKITTHRTDGIQTETKLSLEGSFYTTNFGGSTGSHTNTLYSAKYYTKTSGSSTWSSAYDIPISNFTINTSTGAFSLTDFQIHADGQSGGFTVGTRYDIKIEVKDAKGLLATATNTSTVTDGKIARDVYQDSNGEYHEGINGRADSNYTQKVNGNIGATGDISTGGAFQKNGVNFLRNNGTASILSASNATIAFRPKGDTNETNQATLDNNGNFSISGRADIPEGFRGKRLNGGGGTSGYMYVCDITNNGSYMNQYIQFDVLQRARIGTVIMCFASSGTQGALAISDIKKTGNINVYYLVSNNKLSLYIQKSEAYDDIEIVGLEKGAYSNSLVITWKNQTVTSLPSGYATVSSRPPTIDPGSVLEVGRYIDFHPAGTSIDFSKRIDAGTGTTARTLTLPDESGTFLLSNQIGACCVNNTSDFTITNTYAWQEQKVNLPSTVKNTNTGLFTPTSGGIKVLKAGSYLISGTVNYECADNCSLCIYQNSTMKVTVDQPSSVATMRNISVPVYLMQCNANDVIYLYVRRYGTAGTYVRGMRSYLTVTKIA